MPIKNHNIHSAKSIKIAALNDTLRKFGKGGLLHQTHGFAALDNDIRAEFINLIRTNDEFDDGDDPYGQHDFGAETIGSTTVYWKIDSYDLSMKYLSDTPEDETATKRVMTIMLSNEY